MLDEAAPQQTDLVVEVRGREYVAHVTDKRVGSEHPHVTLLIRLPKDDARAEVLISEDPDLEVGDRFDAGQLMAKFGPRGAKRIAKLLWPRAEPSAG